MKRIGYICSGRLTGRCVHIHKSVDAARNCIERHDKQCRNQGGWSDRTIKRLMEDADGYRIELDLTDEEIQELFRFHPGNT